MKKFFLLTVSLIAAIFCTFSLSACGEKHEHCFDRQVIEEQYLAKEATYTEKAEYYYSCSCGEKGDKTFAHGEMLESKIIFKTLNVENNVASITVSNATTSFDFNTEIEKIGIANYVVSLDEYGQSTVITKRVSLKAGDNVIYVFESIGETINKYTINIRKKPLYIVNFDTNGGNYIQAQFIEEGFNASEPSTVPQKRGYNFLGWEFDFENTAITQNTTINAKWEATTYNIIYELNGGTMTSANPTTYTVEDDITLSVPQREGYDFKGWNDCGKIYKGSTGDKIFTASWKAIFNLSGGTITGVTDHGKTLEEIVIPSAIDGVEIKSIGKEAFTSCALLTSIIIPDSITSMGEAAFMFCINLINVKIGNGVKFINFYAFYGCYKLTSITIPNSVNSIENSAFSSCDKLTSVYYAGTEEEWKKISIYSGNSDLTYATQYYYSEEEPDKHPAGTAYIGNYWYYDKNGDIVVWEIKND